jgi:hypothetical protein
MMLSLEKSELTASLQHLDLFICSSSFEDRCFSIAREVKKKFTNFKSVIFFSENEYQEIIDNAEKLSSVLEGCDSIKVPLNTTEALKNAVKINDTLNTLFENKIFRNILIDITTFTHETLLVLYRLLEFKRSSFENLHVSYVCAKDYSTDTEDPKEKWLSTGISQIRSVIGYPGVSSPARNNHLIVLFGFESDRTKSLIDELQFDTISLGFGAEGKSIANNLQSINYERHNELMKYYVNANKFELSLIDPFETQNDLQKQINKFPNHNTVIAPMNTKISTLGAALLAINNPKVQLIYAKPVDYNSKSYSIAGDHCYLFKV